MTECKNWRELLADGVFWLGVALCCVLLVPVCALMWCVYGVFTVADWLSGRVRTQGAAREQKRERVRWSDGSPEGVNEDGSFDTPYVVEGAAGLSHEGGEFPPMDKP